jgi:CRP-like cAMP-binding protein
MTADKHTITFQAAERIITQGENADQAYIINKGAVRVFIKEGSRKIELATLGAGEIFGETAVFTGGNYGANVDALEECEMTIITPDSLNAMLESADPILSALVQMLIKRLKSTNEALVKSETREFMDIALI